MSLLVLMKCRARDTDALREFLHGLLPGTRAHTGCESIEVYQSADDAKEFLLIERWTSDSDYDNYSAWRRDRGDLIDFARHLDGTPKVSRYAVATS
jgi:quinol monooxygenase YgiN